MIATLAIARLTDGRVRVVVERPQHSAKATRVYSCVDNVRRVFSDLGIPSDIAEFYFKLLPDLEPNELIELPPMYVTMHLLAVERLNPE